MQSQVRRESESYQLAFTFWWRFNSLPASVAHSLFINILWNILMTSVWLPVFTPHVVTGCACILMTFVERRDYFKAIVELWWPLWMVITFHVGRSWNVNRFGKPRSDIGRLLAGNGWERPSGQALYESSQLCSMRHCAHRKMERVQFMALLSRDTRLSAISYSQVLLLCMCL